MAHVGFKSKLSVNDGASQAYVDFDGLVTVNLPGREVGNVDATPLYQTHNYKVKLSTKLIDPGAIKGEMHFTESNYERMTTLLGKVQQTTSVKTTFRLTTVDPDGAGAEVGKVYQSEGFVSKVDEVKIVKEDLMMIPFEITLSGEPTITDATNES